MWLVLGGGGQLGRCLANVLTERDIAFRSLTRRDGDITRKSNVLSIVRDIQPRVIVNAAAWTAVDNAEDHENEAFLVNATAIRNLAEICRDEEIRLVHISTDYVFPGNATTPIHEDEPGNPIGAYGRTKWAGEEYIRHIHPDNSLIIRTAWLYSAYGANFARTMTRRALLDQPVNVVDDQIGQPTSADDLARHIIDLVEHNVPPGTYHGTNSGQATWHEFAQRIYELCGKSPDLVTPVPTLQYPTKAKRPSYSVLAHDKTIAAGVAELQNWTDALASAMPRVVDNIDKD